MQYISCSIYQHACRRRPLTSPPFCEGTSGRRVPPLVPPPGPAHGLEISSLEDSVQPFNQEDVPVSDFHVVCLTHSLCPSNPLGRKRANPLSVICPGAADPVQVGCSDVTNKAEKLVIWTIAARRTPPLLGDMSMAPT